MKKKISISGAVFCFAFGLFTTGSAMAVEEAPGQIVIGDMHVFEVGAALSTITYKEPGTMEESGEMFGVVGSYTYRNGIMMKVEGSYAYGQVDYDGALQDGTPYQYDGIDDYLFELRGLIGYDFVLSPTTTITPYCGLGHRYLQDDAGEMPVGYDRESEYSYSPVGVTTKTDLENGWYVGVTIEYDIFLSGTQTSHMGDVASWIGDVENDQNDGYGVRGSLVVQNQNLVIEPFFRYWDIDESDPVVIGVIGNQFVALFEPENNSTEIGLKVAWKF